MRKILLLAFLLFFIGNGCRKTFRIPITVEGYMMDIVINKGIPFSKVYLVKKGSEINNSLRGETLETYDTKEDGYYKFTYTPDFGCVYEIHGEVDNSLYLSFDPMSYPQQIDPPVVGLKKRLDIPFAPASWLKVNVIRDFSEPEYSDIRMLGHQKSEVKEDFFWKIPTGATTIKDITTTIYSSRWAVPQLKKVVFQKDLDMPRHDTLDITIRF
jgi:hypothetical protein